MLCKHSSVFKHWAYLQCHILISSERQMSPLAQEFSHSKIQKFNLNIYTSFQMWTCNFLTFSKNVIQLQYKEFLLPAAKNFLQPRPFHDSMFLGQPFLLYAERSQMAYVLLQTKGRLKTKIRTLFFSSPPHKSQHRMEIAFFTQTVALLYASEQIIRATG